MTKKTKRIKGQPCAGPVWRLKAKLKNGKIEAKEWNEFVVSLALTAGAWAVADAYRGTPWLTVDKR